DSVGRLRLKVLQDMAAQHRLRPDLNKDVEAGGQHPLDRGPEKHRFADRTPPIVRPEVARPAPISAQSRTYRNRGAGRSQAVERSGQLSPERSHLAAVEGENASHHLKQQLFS